MNNKKRNNNTNRTDLAIELINKKIVKKHKKQGSISITHIKINKRNEKIYNKKEGNYITIEFKDINKNYNELSNILKTELEELFKINKIKKKDSVLVVGLGNKNITCDSLGVNTLNNLIVTRNTDSLREISSLSPGVMGDTGIETFDIVKGVINEINVKFIIIIDSLKASNIKWLNNTIQITDSGISPGSGVTKKRKEISKDNLGIPVIAIGIPTVIDSKVINKNISNFIITDSNIDYLIKIFSDLLSNTLNNLLLGR